MKKIGRYLSLPRVVTPFERGYLAKLNRIGLVWLAAHLPVLTFVAAVCGTGALFALICGAAVLVGPLVAYFTLTNPRHISIVFGVASMFFGGLLVYFGQGPMQIEMHFYFFVSLALLAVFANPRVVLVAALTIIAHHVVMLALLPRGVFNYQATGWAVAVHATFVVLESAAACFVARSFFDNVMGLERAVLRRTSELDQRNRDLQRLLDQMSEGFLSCDRDGALALEHSRILEQWVGPFIPGAKVWDYLGLIDATMGSALKAGWELLADGVIPVDQVLHALPRQARRGTDVFKIAYQPVVEGETLASMLVIVSDVTAQQERERAEVEQRESFSIFQALTKDRNGFQELIDEGEALLATVLAPVENERQRADRARALHTLKGNTLLYGLGRIAELCHRLEDHLASEAAELTDDQRRVLRNAWNELIAKVTSLGGNAKRKVIEITEGELFEMKSALLEGENRARLLEVLTSWREEPVELRLARLADQAKALANRLGKGPIDVHIHADRLRLPPDEWAEFWTAFVHAIGNAVDHGLEDAEERQRVGKPSRGCIDLSIRAEPDGLRFLMADDGRGIDWKAVRQAAASAGLPNETQEELIAALCTDGLSTRARVSETSGRGVGMGAVRAACVKLGGQLNISSSPGRGTRLEFHFPRGRVAPLPSEARFPA